MGDRDKWERRYLESDEPPPGGDPSAFLVRSLPLLPAPGRCLDLAGGQGRNALFLARRGWDVTLVDLAVAGVARARWAARRERVDLRVAAVDLEAEGLAVPEASVDLVLMLNYHERSLVSRAARWLRSGGALVVQGFGEPPDPARGAPGARDYFWRPNELLQLARPLRVVWYEDRIAVETENPRHPGPRRMVRMIARRTA